MKLKCIKCNKIAVWEYMPSPGGVYFCDDHVPRGCSCNINDYGVEDTDEQGRLLPCIEYDYDPYGIDQHFHLDEDTYHLINEICTIPNFDVECCNNNTCNILYNNSICFANLSDYEFKRVAKRLINIKTFI